MSKRLLSIVAELRSRPAMYLGERSIVRFDSFLAGYYMACAEFVTDASLTAKHHRFSRNISEKYHFGGGYGWMNILLQICNNDEEAALDLFFKEWDEFCALPEEKATDDYDENTPHNEVAE